MKRTPPNTFYPLDSDYLLFEQPGQKVILRNALLLKSISLAVLDVAAQAKTIAAPSAITKETVLLQVRRFGLATYKWIKGLVKGP